MFGKRKDSCPCDHLKELQLKAKTQDESLNSGNTKFKLIDMRLEEMEKDIKDLAKSTEKGFDKVNTSLETLANDLKEQQLKPAKKYDDISKMILTAIITGLVAFILAYIGLK